VGGRGLLRPGEHLTGNWGAFPPHPGVNAVLTMLPNMFWLDGATIPPAVRTGNTRPGGLLRFRPGSRHTGGERTQPGGLAAAAARP
jgi:hypothetical protein